MLTLVSNRKSQACDMVVCGPGVFFGVRFRSVSMKEGGGEGEGQ